MQSKIEEITENKLDQLKHQGSRIKPFKIKSQFDIQFEIKNPKLLDKRLVNHWLA